jgi:hypothetical protein
MFGASLPMLQELQEEEEAGKQQTTPDLDIDDLLDDPELEKLHADRLAAMKQEAERRAQLSREGYGTYTGGQRVGGRTEVAAQSTELGLSSAAAYRACCNQVAGAIGCAWVHPADRRPLCWQRPAVEAAPAAVRLM